MLATVTGLGSGSVRPSEYLSGETGAEIPRLSLGAGLSYYKQAKAKLDSYGSLQIDDSFFRTDGPLDGIAGA